MSEHLKSSDGKPSGQTYEEQVQAGEISAEDYLHLTYGQYVIEPSEGMPDIPKQLTFEEARSHEDSVVIMDGDWGGQIYLTCPMRDVKCGEDDLRALINDIDRLEWECNEGDGSSISYVRVKSDYPIDSGMGGGIVEEGLWIHEEICQFIAKEIKRVLLGEIDRINRDFPCNL